MIQAIKYTIIAASSGLIQIGTFAIFDSLMKLGYTTSYLISLALSVIWNYTINRKYTFKSNSDYKTVLFKAFCFYLVFTPATTFLGKYLTETLLWHDYIVQAINMTLNFILEFIYEKFFVFKDSLEKK